MTNQDVRGRIVLLNLKKGGIHQYRLSRGWDNPPPNLGEYMKRTVFHTFLFLLLVAFVLVVDTQITTPIFAFGQLEPSFDYHRFYPQPPQQAFQYSPYHDADFKVAKVFGRSSGCENADSDIIRMVSQSAVSAGLDPEIAASVIAVESSCNSLAVSGRGALGLMQVMVPIWKGQYNFNRVNLLNPKENIKIGVSILSGLINNYGLKEGIHRYDGLGVGCSSCDLNYTAKILSLARQGEK